MLFNCGLKQPRTAGFHFLSFKCKQELSTCLPRAKHTQYNKLTVETCVRLLIEHFNQLNLPKTTSG